MSENRIVELWLRAAGGEKLPEAEQRELVEALEKDADLRARLLKNDRIDGVMRELGAGEREAELFEKTFLERLSAEQDATRFIRKMESRIEQEERPRPPEPSRPSTGRDKTRDTRRRPTRRSSRLNRGTRPAGYLGPLLVAAAALFGVLLLATVTGSPPDSPGPARDAEARARALKEAEARRREAEQRLRQNEEKRKALTQAEPSEAKEAREKRQNELAKLRVDQEQIERELEQSKTVQEPAPPKKEEENPRPSPELPVKREGTTQAAVAEVLEASGEAFLVTKDGKTPAAPQAGVLALYGLETGSGASRIVLGFADGTRVEIGPESYVSEIKAEKGKRLVVDRGSVARAVVARQPKGEPMVFTTPQGAITVVGTTLRIVVNPDPSRGTRLEVEEGKVELKNLAGKTVLVDSGYYAVSAAGVDLVKKPLPTPAERLLLERGEVTIKFGPEGVQLPDGVLLDSGDEFDRRRGYGWKGPKNGPAIPGASSIDADGRRTPAFSGRYASKVRQAPDVLRASAVVGGWANSTETWKMPLPNGRYLVSVMAGYTEEEGWEQGPHHVRIQGKLILDAVMTMKGLPAFKDAVPVEVKDGELSMTIGGHLSSKKGTSEVSSTRINYLVIKKASN